MAIAWPLTLTGKISPIITQDMGPKLICTSPYASALQVLCTAFLSRLLALALHFCCSMHQLQ